MALFAASLAWAVLAAALAARAASGLSIHYGLESGFSLLNAICRVFVLVTGFAVLESISGEKLPLRQTSELPWRSSARSEWATGAALGWAMVLLVVAAMFAGGTLHIHLWLQARAFRLVLLNLLTAALFSLASEIAFRGYAYRRLSKAIGSSWATVIMPILFALITTFNQDSTYISTLSTILFGFLLCLAWLRTHGLWLSWGIHFAWLASTGILFGLPARSLDGLSSVVQTRAIGPVWLTGGDVGLEGTILVPLLLLGGVAVLMRVTRDWAWNYTHEPIIAGGYPMEAAPPPAHVAMESSPPPPPPLVQISGVTPQGNTGDSNSR